jgi:hypothetical protein
MMVLAEHYSSNLSFEVKKGMRAKVEQGGWAHLAPQGYLNRRLESGTRRGDAIIVPDPVQGPLVRQAFELYATGQWPLNRLVGEMERRGMRNRKGGVVSRSKLAVILKSRVYIGKTYYGDLEYDSKHEPLVSKELFETVQQVIAMHNTAGERQRRHHHYLRGTVFCGECGARLSTLTAKGQWTYFYCLGGHNRRTTCKQPSTPAEAVEKGIEALYRSIRLRESIRASIMRELEHEIARRESDRGRAAKAWGRRLEELANERDKLLRAYYADALPLDQFKTEQARIDREVGEAESRLASGGQRLDAAKDVIGTCLKLLQNCGRAYAKASDVNRKRWNRTVFRAIYITDRRISRVEYNEPFDALLSPGSSKAVLVDLGGH